MLVAETRCVSVLSLFSYCPEENSKEGCACKLSKAPMTLTLELSYRISIASGIYIRRLDTRTLPRERKGRKDQPILRQCIAIVRILMDEFLIGQFVPSRSDEQFHDGVVSPLIRLKRIYYGFVCTSLVNFRDFSRRLLIWEGSLRSIVRSKAKNLTRECWKILMKQTECILNSQTVTIILITNYKIKIHIFV